MRYLVIFSIVAASAGAKDVNCDNANTIFEQRECLYKSLKKADKELNLNYKLLMKAIKKKEPESKRVIKRLKKAQRAWIKYRDAECAFSGFPMLDGSAESLLRAGCKIRLTKKRAKELKNYLKEINRK